MYRFALNGAQDFVLFRYNEVTGHETVTLKRQNIAHSSQGQEDTL